MITPPLPDNEHARLALLRALLLLDTPPEERMDKIVEFASAEFDVPICLISLVDSDRQWFKARIGIAACETPRDISFCAHAILGSGLLLVPDALLDRRFCDNPLVTGTPRIRFYAGAPLVCENGLALGTLCLIDTRPRTLDQVEQAILESLRDLALLELTAAQGKQDV
ncbi:GAF domain-containing protein [Massilia litorea]|jgi:GAF domain-containing protein|uniref:GAF domain-containing protein n=1 Tax=Massilia litorea TaxID=2769491 RepID=A0A7L9U582_9BURK|nr:GAF domain-containing protein [Massilia litorea]QOL50000.1 GAF domain-containing protein [Massilia litorea]